MAENISQDGGAQSFLKQKQTPNELLIKRVHSRFGHNWAISSKQHLLELLGKNNGVYEVTTSYPHKVYFDIDKISSVKINEVEYMKVYTIQMLSTLYLVAIILLANPPLKCPCILSFIII